MLCFLSFLISKNVLKVMCVVFELPDYKKRFNGNVFYAVHDQCQVPVVRIFRLTTPPPVRQVIPPLSPFRLLFLFVSIPFLFVLQARVRSS